jgi:hypothetical protein
MCDCRFVLRYGALHYGKSPRLLRLRLRASTSLGSSRRTTADREYPLGTVTPAGLTDAAYA